MRCYFVRAGHIAGVEMLTGLSDKDAIAKALLLFSERRPHFDEVEVWDQTRFIFRHPDADKKPGVDPRRVPTPDDGTRQAASKAAHAVSDAQRRHRGHI